MNEKTIEDALNLLISGELDLVDTGAGRGIQYQDLCGGWDIDAGQRPCPSNGGRERVSDHHQAEQMSRNRPARAVCRG